MEQEKEIFEACLKEKGLKHSNQRDAILDVFLRTERHVSAEELSRIVKENHPRIGFVTVYRTLKLLCECGLSRELKFNDGTARYEHLYGHAHHDHLICTVCGELVEITEPRIEQLQEKIFETHGFIPQGHRMDLYGICRKCKTR